MKTTIRLRRSTGQVGWDRYRSIIEPYILKTPGVEAILEMDTNYIVVLIDAPYPSKVKTRLENIIKELLG